MLSQRTIGRFQRFLEELFRPQFYGESSAVTPRSYYTMLYEADVPGQLLDLIASRTMWDPAVLARALHEGVAIAQASGKAPHKGISEDDRAVGDVYVLCFAAVALNRYEQLDYDHRVFFEDSGRALVESLSADGYRYERGVLTTHTGEVVSPTPLNEKRAKTVATSAPPKRAPEGVANGLERQENELQPPHEQGRPWTRDQKLIVWSIIATILVGALAIPEFRGWLTLQFHKLQFHMH